MNIETNNELKATVAVAGLHEVIDPEIGLNIIDLGLVYRIDFPESKGKIILTMTLTTQFCPMGEAIVGGAENVMRKLFEGYDVEINLTFEPPWNPSRISEEGRKFLNIN